MKYIIVYLISMFKFIGGPAFGAAYDLNIAITASMTILGMMTSVVIISFFGIKFRNWIQKKYRFEKKLFTKRNRRLVRIWRGYGEFGVSFFTSNLTGLIYSFGSLVLFYLFIRKKTSPLIGILFLLFIGFNYNHIFYGRLPFLEHAMAFYAFLSLVLLTYFDNYLSLILAGVSLGVGIFFGKII